MKFHNSILQTKPQSVRCRNPDLKPVSFQPSVSKITPPAIQLLRCRSRAMACFLSEKPSVPCVGEMNQAVLVCWASMRSACNVRSLSHSLTLTCGKRCYLTNQLICESVNPDEDTNQVGADYTVTSNRMQVSFHAATYVCLKFGETSSSDHAGLECGITAHNLVFRCCCSRCYCSAAVAAAATMSRTCGLQILCSSSSSKATSTLLWTPKRRQHYHGPKG